MNRKILIFLTVIFLYVILLKNYFNLLLATIVFAYFTEVFIDIFNYLRIKLLDLTDENKKIKLFYLFSLILKSLRINILFVYAFYLFFVVFFIFFIFMPVINQVITIIKAVLNQIPNFVNNILSIVQSYNIPSDRFTNLDKVSDFGKVIEFVLNYSLKFLGSLTTNLGDWFILILVPLLSLYFIDAKKEFLTWIEHNFKGLIVEFFKKYDYYQKIYIKAILINILTIMFLSSGVFFIFFGFDGVSYGIIYGLFSFIPIVGPIIGSLPVLIISFGKSFSFGLAIFFIVFLIQQISDNFVMPKTVERFLVITPFLSIISILAFYSLINFWAVFIAVPLALTFKSIIEQS